MRTPSFVKVTYGSGISCFILIVKKKETKKKKKDVSGQWRMNYLPFVIMSFALWCLSLALSTHYFRF